MYTDAIVQSDRERICPRLPAWVHLGTSAGLLDCVRWLSSHVALSDNVRVVTKVSQEARAAAQAEL